MSEESKKAHGGYRPGAGRKPKQASEKRPQNQMRAYPEEWELIKKYAKIVREDKERAKRILETK